MPVQIINYISVQKKEKKTFHLQFLISAHHFNTTGKPKILSRTMTSLIIFHILHREENTQGYSRNQGWARVIILNSTVWEIFIRLVTVIWCALEKYQPKLNTNAFRTFKKYQLSYGARKKGTIQNMYHKEWHKKM